MRRAIHPLALVLALLCLIVPRPAFGESLDRTVLANAIAATVQIGPLLTGADGSWSYITNGSGAVITTNGLILTNHHVIAPPETPDPIFNDAAADGYTPDWTQFAILVTDGRSQPQLRFVAEIVADDLALDLAVLRITQDEVRSPIDPTALNLAVLPTGDDGALVIGDPLSILGYPTLGDGTVIYTTGIVSGFLFEAGIEGPAWIITDAVASGGSSGGPVLNAQGQLIGTMTQGQPLDCRIGDTNLDGVTDASDLGCRATGGSLGELRPISVALPLIQSVDPSFAGGTAPVVAAAPVDAGRACAQRGDWRCAADFLTQAAAADPALANEAYDALINRGALEEDAGQLAAGQEAYITASSLLPDRPEASARRAILDAAAEMLVADGFSGQENYQTSSDGTIASSYVDGAFRFTIADNTFWTYPIGDQPFSAAATAIALDLRQYSGNGFVLIDVTGPAGSWTFAVDPIALTVTVLQLDAASNSLSETVTETSFAEVVPGAVSRVEVRLRGGVPMLWINGRDVSSALGLNVPTIGETVTPRFGASARTAGTPFEVDIDRLAVLALR